MTPTAESVTTTPIQIPIGRRTYLDADVTVPSRAKGVVLFAHGSGSSRHSPRNRYVASQLNFVIVGGDDHTVLRMNQNAYRRLTGFRELEVVPGATHLFEEPGTLELVANVAGAFFLRHLPSHELR